MTRRLVFSFFGVVGLFGLIAVGCGPHPGTGTSNENENSNGNGNENANSNRNQNPPPDCPNGTDLDHDGYGEGCPAGPDCRDDNNLVHPGVEEICNGVDDNCDGQTDEGVLTDCGNCSEYCTTFDLGNDPFPMPGDDSNAEANGVNLDPNGDLILDQSNVNFNFLWIANRYDAESRGTISKVDTVNAVEVARYYTVTCFGNQAYQ
ncbi:MAG: putative metal-binding motif-containing protein, partial [Deltaproteobacteria bacterium]|nr:putative metal-binding motif-containing protein [Deltaproteobacteria bacterium]